MATDGPVDCYGDWAVVVVGCALVSGLVRAMTVVMLGILDQDPGGVVSVVDQDAVGALGTDGTHEPLGKTVRSRDPWRRLDDRDVLAAEHGVEARGELRVPVPLIRSLRSMARLRAAWVTHGPVGWAVTPRMWTRRVGISITNRTYRRRRNIVSRWKKSQASSPSAGARRKARQEVSASRGAGPSPRARRIRRTVDSPSR